MTNKRKRRYRLRDRRDYNSALARRGSLTLRVEEGTVGRWRDSATPARRGRRRLYSDLAIACALTLREVYGLPPRATQGLVRSVLRLLGQVEGEVAEVLGDGAYDSRDCLAAIAVGGALSHPAAEAGADARLARVA